MTSVTQKFTDIVLIGKGNSIEVIKHILSYQTKKTYKHYAPKDFRFINTNTVVIDGQKVSAKEFLIVVPQKRTTRSFQVHGDHPLPSNKLDQLLQTLTKSVCIIGDDDHAIHHCLELVSKGISVTLLCESKVILASYDMSVQGIVERYIKKRGICVVKGAPILSIEPKNNSVNIICEQSGKPINVNTEKVHISPNMYYDFDFGQENIGSASELQSNSSIHKFSNRILVIQEDSNIGLGTLYEITSKLLGSSKKSISYIPRMIYSSESIQFFSIGILEQDYYDTHFSYKKVVVKLQSTDKSVQWFIKVLASHNNTIIGIHGVLPYNYKNMDLLIGLVENRGNVSELQKQCLANDELSNAFIKIIGELS